MRPTVILLCVLCVVALVWGAPDAQAEERAALERLTAEERAHLESQVSGWAELSAERQEKIARTVIRIRELPEAQRRALLERIQRLKRGREAGRGPRPERLGHHLDPRRMQAHRHRGHVMRAVGAVLWGELPEATRTAIEGSLEKRDRGRVAMAFFRRFVGRIAEERAREGVPPIPVSPDLPPKERKGLEALRAKAEAGDERALERLAHMSVVHDLQRAAAELGRDGPPDEAAMRRLGARVHEAYPEAFAASVAELTEAAHSEEALRRYAPHGRGGPHGRQAGPPESQARRLLEALDQSGGLLRKHPELKEHVRALKHRLREIVGEGPPDRMGPGRRPGGRRGPPGGRGPRRGPEPPPDGPEPPPEDEGK